MFLRRGGLRRRRFLQLGATAALAGHTISCTSARSPWRFFTVEEARTVEAVCERIIPADEEPGAAWAGVTHYIDRQLVGHFKPDQKTYRLGLAAVDRTSRALHGARFADLSAEKQSAVLTALEQNSVPAGAWQGVEPRPFFNMMVTHTMQGFYGSPRHGGNREAVSWRMIGLPAAPVRGRLQYDGRKG
jgi:gluconate 2-dehydrogenase gamma chain